MCVHTCVYRCTYSWGVWRSDLTLECLPQWPLHWLFFVAIIVWKGLWLNLELAISLKPAAHLHPQALHCSWVLPCPWVLEISTQVLMLWALWQLDHLPCHLFFKNKNLCTCVYALHVYERVHVEVRDTSGEVRDTSGISSLLLFCFQQGLFVIFFHNVHQASWSMYFHGSSSLSLLSSCRNSEILDFQAMHTALHVFWGF